MDDPAVQREPHYFGDGNHALFGWLHTAQAAPRAGCVAVICPPIGSEYTYSHRTLRHLADRLARSGIPALRFDFHGSGDSPGSDLDPGRLAEWRRNVASAVSHARSASGCAAACLVGVRLGATIAALASADVDIEYLVLWNPVVKGRGFVRELQASGASAEAGPPATEDAGGAIEGGGYLVTAETAADLRTVDLLSSPIRVGRRALVVARDQAAADDPLSRRLSELGIAHDAESGSGWNDMMTESQFSQVPHATLDTIAAWIAARASEAATPAAPASGADRLPALRVFAEGGDGPAIEETAHCFGPGAALFGILGRTSADTARPAVVMFNAGAVHHVGPHRLYVEIARGLAALGFATFRFDLESIGDSVLRGAGRENHPYPDTAPADAQAALDLLSGLGYRSFILLGLCSGAHTAFHAGLATSRHAIADVVLVNPRTFHWREGMTLDTRRPFSDLRVALHDPRRWLRVLKGEAVVRQNLHVVVRHARSLVRSRWSALQETVRPGKGTLLSSDLQRLLGMKRRLLLLISEGDPGYDILMAEARRTVTRALKTGDIVMERIPGADHTFSQSRPRADFTRRLYRLLVSRAATPAAGRAA